MLDAHTIQIQRRALLEAEKLYAKPEFMASDPVELVHAYTDPLDQEVAALLCALFAYGNVKAMRGFLSALLSRMKTPSSILSKNFDPARIAGKLYYRFQSTRDLRIILEGVSKIFRRVHKRAAGLESIFEGPTLRERISSFQKEFAHNVTLTRGVLHWIGSPESTGAQKRFCMFLRWMTRTTFPDFGLYKTFHPRDLIVPLDVHMARMAQNLNWTTAAGAGWKNAVEITGSLATIEPEDPLRFDFVITRPGILGVCRSILKPACDHCPVRRPCKVYGQKILA